MHTLLVIENGSAEAVPCGSVTVELATPAVSAHAAPPGLNALLSAALRTARLYEQCGGRRCPLQAVVCTPERWETKWSWERPVSLGMLAPRMALLPTAPHASALQQCASAVAQAGAALASESSVRVLHFRCGAHDPLALQGLVRALEGALHSQRRPRRILSYDVLCCDASLAEDTAVVDVTKVEALHHVAATLPVRFRLMRCAPGTIGAAAESIAAAHVGAGVLAVQHEACTQPARFLVADTVVVTDLTAAAGTRNAEPLSHARWQPALTLQAASPPPHAAALMTMAQHGCVPAGIAADELCAWLRAPGEAHARTLLLAAQGGAAPTHALSVMYAGSSYRAQLRVLHAHPQLAPAAGGASTVDWLVATLMPWERASLRRPAGSRREELEQFLATAAAAPRTAATDAAWADVSIGAPLPHADRQSEHGSSDAAARGRFPGEPASVSVPVALELASRWQPVLVTDDWAIAMEEGRELAAELNALGFLVRRPRLTRAQLLHAGEALLVLHRRVQEHVQSGRGSRGTAAAEQAGALREQVGRFLHAHADVSFSHAQLARADGFLSPMGGPVALPATTAALFAWELDPRTRFAVPAALPAVLADDDECAHAGMKRAAPAGGGGSGGGGGGSGGSGGGGGDGGGRRKQQRPSKRARHVALQ